MQKMKSGKTQVILVSDNGFRKMRTFSVRLSFLRVLLALLLICVCAIPLLESSILILTDRISELDKGKMGLHQQIANLKYLERTLNQIEEKEGRLKSYFGVDKYRTLEQMIGIGGYSPIDFSKVHPTEAFEEGGLHNHPNDVDERYQNQNLPEKLEVLTKNIETLNKLMLDQQESWSDTPSIVPVEIKRPKISSAFGWRKNPFTNRREFHAGIDIIGPKGTKIIAPARGVVLRTGYDQWLGHYLVLKHNEQVKTIYGHLKMVSAKKGESVQRGELLGIMGNSGLSTSRHLHYVVLVKGRVVNPMQFIVDARGS